MGRADLFFPEFSKAWGSIMNPLKGKKVAVIGHIRPDGDSIGSQIALVRMLNHWGVKATALCFDAIPKLLTPFAEGTEFRDSESHPANDWDAVVAVDCSASNRMGELYQSRFSKIHLCIDHHVSNTGFARTNWIASEAAATSEIIAGIAHDLNIAIDKATAQALYVGIATDTGQFCYAATTQRVLNLCAHLIGCGAEPHPIAHQLYEKEPKSRTQLLAAFLSSLEFHFEDRFVFGKITQQMFAETNTTREQTEGFINHARNTDTCDIAALLEEQGDGSVKGSLRSKFPKFQVDKLAAKIGGGGHACAAGFHSQMDITTFPKELLKMVKAHLDSL